MFPIGRTPVKAKPAVGVGAAARMPPPPPKGPPHPKKKRGHQADALEKKGY